MGACRTISCVAVIIVAALLGLTQGFYWAMLGLSPNSDSGLIALFCVSAIVMLIICIIGILGACNVCYPIFMIMWLIGMVILIAVITVQIILRSVVSCPATTGTQSIVCSSPFTYAALGITLGLAVLGFIWGIILFRILHEEEGGGGGSSSSSSKSSGKNDFVY